MHKHDLTTHTHTHLTWPCLTHVPPYHHMYGTHELCKHLILCWYYFCAVDIILTPNALNRFRRGCRSCLFKNTSDFGLGGFLGRIMTRVSSRISSSSSLLSEETDNCRWTRSWSFVPDQSANEKERTEICLVFKRFTTNLIFWFLITWIIQLNAYIYKVNIWLDIDLRPLQVKEIIRIDGNMFDKRVIWRR